VDISKPKQLRAGVISDTHGLVRPEALDQLHGVDHIIHAGDIGSPMVLEELRKIAPLTAIRGNVDTQQWARSIPENAVVELGGIFLYVLHNLQELDLDPYVSGFSAVITGHSHQPRHEVRKGVLYFNPGSAGPRRFRLPVAVGILTIEGKLISGEIIELEV
jgi:putative phosphoesterase